MSDKNLFNCLIDDLLILNDSLNFKYVGYDEDVQTITIKTLRVEAFRLSRITSLIGFLLGPGKVTMDIDLIHAEDVQDDVFSIKFKFIARKGNRYEGILRFVKDDGLYEKTMKFVNKNHEYCFKENFPCEAINWCPNREVCKSKNALGGEK